MKQKDIFLNHEANAWFERNRQASSNRNFSKDDIVLAVHEISKLSEHKGEKIKVLEIGCGEGGRLNHMKEVINCSVYGIDPSDQAVNNCMSNGISAKIGTADNLPHENNSFDVLIFGFCLYLCDREDLFRITMEADRVLKAEGWLIIKDFYEEHPMSNEYHHTSGVRSYKMDYKSLFTWHPNYTCYQNKVYHHEDQNFTDQSNEWVATSVIRKISCNV